jgi:hypothetical protein
VLDLFSACTADSTRVSIVLGVVVFNDNLQSLLLLIRPDIRLGVGTCVFVIQMMT